MRKYEQLEGKLFHIPDDSRDSYKLESVMSKYKADSKKVKQIIVTDSAEFENKKNLILKQILKTRFKGSPHGKSKEISLNNSSILNKLEG